MVMCTDGSCKPEPGIDGAVLVIQGSQWLELEFPIKVLTKIIGCEIEAICQALIYEHYIPSETRVVIPSDSKFSVNEIHNKWSSETYNFPIGECQKLLKILGESQVPEIHWIKGHAGIPGNERADAVAKRLRFKEELEQPELYRRPSKTAPFLNAHGLMPSFTAEWNRHWANANASGAEMN